MAGRPGKTKLDKMRANAWFTYVSRAAGGASAYQLEQMNLGDVDGGGGENVWSRYKRGDRVPSKYLVDRVDQRIEGSKSIFERGPGGLFALRKAESITEALKILSEEAIGIEGREIFCRDYDSYLFPVKIDLGDFTRIINEINEKYTFEITPFDLSITYVYHRFLDFNFPFLSNQLYQILAGPEKNLSKRLVEIGIDPELFFDVFPELTIFPIGKGDHDYTTKAEQASERINKTYRDPHPSDFIRTGKEALESIKLQILNKAKATSRNTYTHDNDS